MEKETFVKKDFQDLSFEDTILENKCYTDCIFDNSNFTGSEIKFVTFIRCSFVSCRFNDAVMENCAFLNCLFRFANLFAVTMRRTKLTGSSFLLTSFVSPTIEDCDFSYCDLRQTDFSKLTLQDIRFTGADLSECRFENGRYSCHFENANTNGASFKNSDLRNSKLDGIPIGNTHFSHTKIDLEAAVLLAQFLGADYTP